jgi:hypothetical protein
MTVVNGTGGERPQAPAHGRVPPSIALIEPMLVHEPKRQATVFLLCLFLGWLGCHRYYVGKRGTGRLYLATGGLCFVGVLVDLVLILTGSFKDRFDQPLA